MARKAPKSKPKAVEPEGNEGPHGRITKSEAARRALAAGYDKPQEAVAYILGQFGIEMGAQHFSSIKTAMKNGATPTRDTPQAAPAAVKEAPQASVSNGETGLLESLEALKPLIAQYGADKVKRLVDLLG